MATIYKFKLTVTDVQHLAVPSGSTPLHVGLDSNKDICLWMKVPDPDVPHVKRTAFCVGTGRDIPDAPLTHVGSVCQGPFIWHFFLLDIIGDQHG